MLYKNRKLVEAKDRDLFKKFKEEFKNHLLANGAAIDPSKPIVIKYIDSLTTQSKENDNRPQHPRSIALNYTAMVSEPEGMVEYRYSPTPAIVEPNGNLKFSEASVDIIKRLSVTDIDLAFFFWAYSTQNAEPQKENQSNSKYFVVENREKENLTVAQKRKQFALVDARLWTDPDQGGLSEAALIAIANDMMIPGVSAITDINEIKILIETNIKSDKTNKTRDRFLTMSDKMTDADRKNAETKGLIQKAIDAAIINYDKKDRRFTSKPVDGKADIIWDARTYNGDPKTGFFEYLSNYKPELLEWMSQELNKTKEPQLA